MATTLSDRLKALYEEVTGEPQNDLDILVRDIGQDLLKGAEKLVPGFVGEMDGDVRHYVLHRRKEWPDLTPKQKRALGLMCDVTRWNGISAPMSVWDLAALDEDRSAYIDGEILRMAAWSRKKLLAVTSTVLFSHLRKSNGEGDVIWDALHETAHSRPMLLPEPRLTVPLALMALGEG